jgi:hypothetical protein
MLDLNLPVAAIESVAGNEVMVSMHSIRCSINESQVAPAMVTEVFTSAIARAVRSGKMKCGSIVPTTRTLDAVNSGGT